MTDIDMEMQQLRRENLHLMEENKSLRKQNEDLKTMHFCDQGELVRLRRQVDFLLGTDEG